MEIVVAGRHTEVSPKFRAHLTDKLAKVEQLAPAPSGSTSSSRTRPTRGSPTARNASS